MDPYSTQMLMMNQIQHLSSGFIEHIRSVLFALSLVILGLIVAEIVKYLAVALLRLLRWDRFSRWIGLSRVLARVRGDVSPATATGEAVFWLVLLSFSMKALIISDIHVLMGWGQIYFDLLPAVGNAAVILLAARVLSVWLGALILLLVEQQTTFLAAGLTRALVLCLGVYFALLQLGVESNLAQPLILILFGGAALAGALAWSRDRAGLYREVIRVGESREGGR